VSLQVESAIRTECSGSPPTLFHAGFAEEDEEDGVDDAIKVEEAPAAPVAAVLAGAADIEKKLPQEAAEGLALGRPARQAAQICGLTEARRAGWMQQRPTAAMDQLRKM